MVLRIISSKCSDLSPISLTHLLDTVFFLMPIGACEALTRQCYGRRTPSNTMVVILRTKIKFA